MALRPGPDSEFGFAPLSDEEQRAQVINVGKDIVLEVFGIALHASDHPFTPAEATIACITLQHAREKGVDAEFIENAWLGIRAGSTLDELTHEQAVARLLRPQE